MGIQVGTLVVPFQPTDDGQDGELLCRLGLDFDGNAMSTRPCLGMVSGMPPGTAIVTVHWLTVCGIHAGRLDEGPTSHHVDHLWEVGTLY